VRRLADSIPERYPGQRNADGTSNVAFPYSLYFVFYEQYTYIMGVAVQDVLLAIGVVFLSTALITNIPTALCIILMVVSIIINVLAVLYLWNLGGGYGVRINAVSVVNIVMGVGLSVEFVVHIASAFLFNTGSRENRAKSALSSMGASVFSGITLTKLVGISVLAVAPSHLFRVYYFRMYTALIAAGAFMGLAFFPVLLSMIGPGTDLAGGKAVRMFKGSSEWLGGGGGVSL
jgi:Niemann-Pick C1 protein